ncbi:hypothetical protein [Burkholderia gladioli]|uniref:hypothetical protein n=1 Tax=Burkholderia gladioli TaxID=28095 RepID=UPI001FC8C3B8|nr:hypothetical protein [Burkholderia gladioli]
MHLPEVVSALFVSIIQVGIAVGSAAGGTIVDRPGAPADFVPSLALALLSLSLRYLLASPLPRQTVAVGVTTRAATH